MLSNREIRGRFLFFRAETVKQYSLLYHSLEFKNWNAQKIPPEKAMKRLGVFIRKPKIHLTLDKLESVYNEDQVNVFFLLKIDLFFNIISLLQFFLPLLLPVPPYLLFRSTSYLPLKTKEASKG